MIRAARDRARTDAPWLAPTIDSRLRRLAAMLEKQRGDEADRDWARGLARLLTDREALDRAVTDPNRAPKIPPGMPIGSGEEALLAN